MGWGCPFVPIKLHIGLTLRASDDATDRCAACDDATDQSSVLPGGGPTMAVTVAASCTVAVYTPVVDVLTPVVLVPVVHSPVKVPPLEAMPVEVTLVELPMYAPVLYSI